METFAIFAAALAATTAFLIGLLKIGGNIAALIRRQGRLDNLLRRELTGNGNGGLKARVIEQGKQQAEQGEVQVEQGDIDHVQNVIDEHLEEHDDDPHAHQPDN